MLHIVQEALSNVRKHARATRVWLDVQQQPQWRFEVRDDGEGFLPESGPPDETHVGMRIMAERADRIGASLDVLSTPGRGTSIVLTLPRPCQQSLASTVDRGRSSGAALTAMSSTARATIRILVVDDHTLFRRGMTALLAREPMFEVIGDAADAGEAQRRALELQPDLILLDNHLPGVNGVDALPALREAAPAARVLMLTVSEDEQDLAAALRNGACGYLLKTMEGDALAKAIVRAMRGESVVADEMTGKLVAAYRQAAATLVAGGIGAAAIADRAAVPARAGNPARHRARSEQQGHCARARHRRDHGQDPRAAHVAQARRRLARAGSGYRNRARAGLT